MVAEAPDGGGRLLPSRAGESGRAGKWKIQCHRFAVGPVHLALPAGLGHGAGRRFAQRCAGARAGWRSPPFPLTLGATSPPSAWFTPAHLWASRLGSACLTPVGGASGGGRGDWQNKPNHRGPSTSHGYRNARGAGLISGHRTTWAPMSPL